MIEVLGSLAFVLAVLVLGLAISRRRVIDQSRHADETVRGLFGLRGEALGPVDAPWVVLARPEPTDVN